MVPVLFYDRVKCTVSGTPGTGTVTVGSAVAGYQTPAQAGAADTDTVPVVFEDGSAWEESTCVLSSTQTVLTRTLVRSSTGSLLSLTSAATFFIAPFKEQLNTAPLLWRNFFGDGSDGDVTISGSTTLTRSMCYNNLTISTGAVINHAGFIIRVKGTLDITASPAGWFTYLATGTVGSGSGATGGSAFGLAAQTAGNQAEFGTNSVQTGGAGGTGTTTTPAAGGTPSATVRYLAGKSGTGGAGGSGVFGSGGAAGTTSSLQENSSFMISPKPLANYGNFYSFSTVSQAGGGGGAGAGDNAAGAGGGGGGAGLAGGIIAIYANIINRGGSTTAAGIQSKGYAGGNGGNGAGAVGAGGGGGGPGGGGGYVYIIYGSLTGSTATNLIDVTGGNGGNGGTGTITGTGGEGGGAGAGGRVVIGCLSTGVLTTYDANPTPVAGGAHSGTTGGTGATATTTQVSL